MLIVKIVIYFNMILRANVKSCRFACISQTSGSDIDITANVKAAGVPRAGHTLSSLFHNKMLSAISTSYDVKRNV